MAMVITDPGAEDNPIIFANRAFAELTGYDEAETLGRNCRFLQGEGTDPECRAKLRACVEQQEDLHVEILNYRKDGAPFWNSLFVSPVRDASGEVIYFFASQIDVTERREEEERTRRLAEELAEAKKSLESQVHASTAKLQETLEARTRLLLELDHRVKNNLQLMISLVNIEKRQRVTPSERQAQDVVAGRLQALGVVHRRLYNQGLQPAVPAEELLEQIAQELQAQSGRRDVDLAFEVDPVEVSSDNAGPFALLVNELVAAALRFAYQGRAGVLTLRLRHLGDGAFEFAMADKGCTPLEKDTVQASAGGALLSGLARQLEGVVDWRTDDPDILVSVKLPPSLESTDGVS